MKTYLAVDIGASSGRHILGWLEDGKMRLSEVYRFKNGAAQKNGRLCWDADGLQRHVLAGLRACAARTPFTMGTRSWAIWSRKASTSLMP